MPKLIRRSFLKDQPYILIYGNGNSNGVFRSFVLNKLPTNERPEVILTIDRSIESTPKIVEGKLLGSPKYLENNKSIYMNVVIVICLGRESDVQDVRNWLKSIGFTTVISMQQFQDFHCGYDTQTSSVIDAKFASLSAKILEVKSKLSDELSIKIIDQFIATFKDKRSPKIPVSDVNYEQIEPGINFLTSLSNTRILNCGAYTGDTVTRFFQNLEGISDLICLLEPSLSNYKKLAAKATSLKLASKEVICLPIGAGSEVGSIRKFSPNGGVSSASEDGDIEMDSGVIGKVDEMFLGVRFTHLIIDIEGFELRFLEGAKSLISSCRPKICIAAYHYPLDIIEIPLWLSELNIGYSFYLRNYSGHNPDTLIYAIPS